MTSTLPPCPDCGTPLTGDPTCASCGLRVVGPTAVRLWQVDQRLAALDGERTALLTERARLLLALRSGEEPVAAPSVGPTSVVPAPVVRKETSPKQVQNTLLGLGAMLLAGAGVVFAAVTYQQLGVVGRALVLLTLTAAAAATPLALTKRSLTSSAEAVGAVAVVLAVLDVWALRRAGVGDAIDVSSYSAGATAALALLAAGWTRLVPLHVGALSSAAFAQLPIVFVLDRTEASLPVSAVALAVLAGVDLLVASERRVPRYLRLVTAGLGALAALGALALSAGAVADGDRGAGAGLLALAMLAAAGAVRVEPAVFGGLTVWLAAGAAWATARPSLIDPQEPLVPVAVALLALQAVALLPRQVRVGPVVGSLAVVGMALLAVVEPVALALAGPVSWLGDPWSLTATEARDALTQGQRWPGTIVTVVVLAAAAACAIAAGFVLDRLRDASLPAAVLLVLSALVLPLGLATSYTAALVILLVLAAAFCAAGLLTPALFRIPLVAGGFGLALLAATWSVADRQSTLLVLPVVAALGAALSLRLPPFALPAALLAGAELAAVGAWQGLAADQVGGLLLIAPAAWVGLSFVVRGPARVALEAAAATLAFVSVVLCVVDPGWLSWSLAAAGLMGLAVAIRPDRRLVGLVGGLLLSASSWVRLADAGVEAPEPYVAPLAVAALVFGYLRRRSATGVSSFTAYGPGLTVALLPSLLKSFDDPTPTRGLLLLVVCVGVVLLGVKDRLQAPLVIGGAVLAADTLQLLAPYASALPRWSLLAAAGALVFAVGATYEQRLRDMARLRAGYDTWG